MSDVGRIHGTGVYVIYYSGNKDMYLDNGIELALDVPIYVGKAVPSGWRNGREGDDRFALAGRLKDHAKSIRQAQNLSAADFQYSYLVLVEQEADIIPAVESGLIREFSPVWNSLIPGFGNHDPGSGRYDQAVSVWDTAHPGRPWVEKLTGAKPQIEHVIHSPQKQTTKQLGLGFYDEDSR